MSKQIRHKRITRQKIITWSDIVMNKTLDLRENICMGYYIHPYDYETKHTGKSELGVRLFQFIKKEEVNQWFKYSFKNKINWTDTFSVHDPGRMEVMSKEYFNSFNENKDYVLMRNEDLIIGTPLKENYLPGKWSDRKWSDEQSTDSKNHRR